MSVAPAQPSPVSGYLPYGHAHNDYEHDRPLYDALAHGFYSVEADIWYDGGRIEVSHLGVSSRGTLAQLYLDPLQARVDARGSVHGDGEPFTLWLDIKDGDRRLEPALQALLDRYAMLNGPVRLVLTGERDSKTAFVSHVSPCPAARDSNDFDPDDPPADRAWRYYALDWSKYVGWNGDGRMSQRQRERLQCIVYNAHALGRRVRFYEAPETEAYWQSALDVGVDFIGSDQLEELSEFLAHYER